jgi:hypothetical protein
MILRRSGVAVNAKRPEFLKYYIRVADVTIFNALVASAESSEANAFDAYRDEGYFVLRTNDEILWRDLFLYGQMVAQAQGEYIEAGQD